MPIRVDCLTCRKWYKAPEKAAGRVVKCPGCGGELKVPADAPVIAATPKASPAPRPKPATGPRPFPGRTRAMSSSKSHSPARSPIPSG